MKNLSKKMMMSWLLSASLLYLSSCKKDDPGPQLTGQTKQFALSPVSNSSISGTVTFAKRSDNATVITVQLTGTQAGGSHPAHIHANSAAEGGGIVLDFTAVDGSTGKSETVTKALNDGTPVSYEDLIAFDGYVNVHASSTDIGTLIAQGDIGPNELTNTTKVYTLNSVSNPAVNGTVTFTKRVSGEALVSIALAGTSAGVTSPAHIHENTAAQGGGIVIDLTSVNGATGKSQTSVSKLNSGTAITYDELISFNGYLNVHESDGNLGTLIAQGDIGQNELTGDSKVYTLNPVSNPAVSGTATLAKRVNGQTLVSIALTGTTAGVTSPAHFHANSAAQGGGIVIDLTSVNGTTGKSQTNVSKFNSELLNFNGYLNVHQSTTNLGTLIAQGDIGQNELTGVSKVYTLNSVSDPAISGTATFAKRKSGFTLITLSLTGTTAGGVHPAHIHMNNAAAGGAIVLDLANVNGGTGKSVKNVTQLNDATPITYDQLIVFNGYVNVHLSAAALGTLIAQGNIGSNAP